MAPFELRCGWSCGGSFFELVRFSFLSPISFPIMCPPFEVRMWWARVALAFAILLAVLWLPIFSWARVAVAFASLLAVLWLPLSFAPLFAGGWRSANLLAACAVVAHLIVGARCCCDGIFAGHIDATGLGVPSVAWEVICWTRGPHGVLPSPRAADLEVSRSPADSKAF